MRCIHIYRGAPQLGGIKLHKHFSWFHTAKWGVHRIAPRTVLHVICIVLTMELQPLKTVELHGWVCLPDSLVRNGSTSPIHTDYKRTHTHTHYTHTHYTPIKHKHIHIFTQIHQTQTMQINWSPNKSIQDISETFNFRSTTKWMLETISDQVSNLQIYSLKDIV